MVIKLFRILTGCGHMNLHVLKRYTIKYTVQVKLGNSGEEQQVVAMSCSVERYCTVVLQDVIREKLGKEYMESVLFLSTAREPTIISVKLSTKKKTVTK